MRKLPNESEEASRNETIMKEEKEIKIQNWCFLDWCKSFSHSHAALQSDEITKTRIFDE